ncbi:MAG: tetratricopeptide repeat protein [Bacteroidales bacterium]
MKNEWEYWNDNERNALIDLFEQMLKRGDTLFFDVDDFVSIIDHYMDMASLEMAKVALKHAIKLHPESVVFQVKKAQLLAYSDNAEQALSMLSVVENLEPFNSDIIRTKANIYSQLQQYDNAIKEYKKLSAEEDAEEIFSNIAYEYENMGQYVQAIHYLKKVLAVNPENDNALYELAYCYEATGKTEDSIKYFQVYLDENPLSSIAWFNLGVAYSTLDQHEEALDAFDYSIALEPDYASAYFNKATVLCDQEKYYEAIESYSETLKLETPEALTLQYIAECYQKLEAYDMAIEFYLKAVEINEMLSEAWAGLASVFYETSNYEKALSFIQKAGRMNKQDITIALLHADISKAMDDYEEAVNYYIKARELNDRDADIWLDLAEAVSLRDEDINAGIETLLEAIRLFPANASLYYRLSFYLYTNEQIKEALRYLNDALHIDFNKHREFLEMDDSLLEHPEIITLIEQAKHLYQNS